MSVQESVFTSSSGARRTLIPPMLGLTFSSVMFTLTMHGGAAAPVVSPAPASVLDRAALVLASLCVAALAIAAGRRKTRFPKSVVSLTCFLSIHLAGIASLVISFFDVTGTEVSGVILVLLEAVALAGSALLGFFWLRKLRGTASSAVAAIVIAAASFSALASFTLGAVPVLCHTVPFALAFAQFGAVRVSRSLEVPGDPYPAISETYFGTSKQRFSSHGYLVAAALGMCCIALPCGMSFALTADALETSGMLARVGALAVTFAVAAAGMRAITRSPERSLSTAVWTVLAGLLSISAILCAAASHVPGAASAAAFACSSAGTFVLQAFTWYLCAAFISFGTRDPYYYAALTWLATHLLGLAGEFVAALLNAWSPDSLALNVSVLGFFVFVATQVVFAQLLREPARVQGQLQAQEPRPSDTVYEADNDVADILGKSSLSPDVADGGNANGSDDDSSAPSYTEMHSDGTGKREGNGQEAVSAGEGTVREGMARADAEALSGASNSVVNSVLAIAPESEVALPSVTPDVHIATSIIGMGQRFGLTGREIEVLTLYALGHTQARVSEELHLSTNTVHTHIKRIYDKTNLHSRQEILDYIAEYGG